MHAGVVSLGANNGISPNAAMTMAVATEGQSLFDLNGFNQSLAGLSASNPDLATVTNSAGATSTLTLDLAADSSFDGQIAGNVAVTKAGFANLTLSGLNAYAGNTTVNAGILTITQPTLTPASTVTVANGAVLQLDFAGGETNQVAGLVLDGVSQSPGLYNSTTSSPFIAGTGNLLVASPVANDPTNLNVSLSGGALTLSWPSTHLGWVVQSNAVSLVNTSAWFDISNSQLATNWVINVNQVQTNVFYRLRKP
jgi:autotransporter-associated beta strand protein